MTIVCATRTEARAARRAGLKAAVVGIGAPGELPEGPLVSFGLAGALHDGLACGDVLDAARVVDANGEILWEGGPLGVDGARRVTILATSAVVDGPAERLALHRRTGADAADMESGVLAQSGRLVGCLRAISDTPSAPARAARDRRRRGRPHRVARRAERARSHADGARSGLTRSAHGAEEARGGFGMNGKVLLAAPRSFCAGVDRAIEIVERLLEAHGASDLRPARDRPQRQRRAPARGARRGLRRLRGRRPARGDLRAVGARRRAVRPRELRGARPARRRCRLPARVEGARRGAQVRGLGPPRRPHRPRRPRRGDRDEGRATGADRRRRIARGCRRARCRRQARRRRLPDDALAGRRGGDRHRARGSLRRRSSARAPTTSVTRRRTARTP